MFVIAQPGVSALFIAGKFGHPHVVKLLLDAGVSLSTDDIGAAVGTGHDDVVALLIDEVMLAVVVWTGVGRAR